MTSDKFLFPIMKTLAATAAAAGGITEDAGASPAGQRDHLQRGPRRGEGAGDMQDSAGDR